MENEGKPSSHTDNTFVSDHPIDTKIFDNLRELMGNDFIELLNVFLSSVPDQLASLKESANKSDSDGISRTAHSLKSSSGNLGALALCECCSDLESWARTGKTEGSMKSIEKIEAEFLRVKTVFEAEISKTS